MGRTRETNSPSNADGNQSIEQLNISQVANLIGSWEWDVKLNKLFWTDAMFQLRAIPVRIDKAASFDGNESFIHEDDREMVKEKFASLSQMQELSLEYRVVAADRKTKLVAARATVFRDEQGAPLFVRGTCEDITAQREAENKWKAINLAFEYAEEISDMGNWQFKLQSNELLLSNNLYRLLGCAPGSFESSFEKLLEFVHPEDQEKIKLVLSESIRDQVVYPVEYRVIRKDGDVRYIKSKGKLLRNIYGETVVLGTVQDITREVATWRILEQKSSFAEMLIENSVDHIAAYDSDLHIIAWNRKNEERYGVKKQDAIGKHVSQVQHHSAQLQTDLARALNGEQVSRASELTQTTNGIFEYFLIPLKDPDGKVFGVLSILHDLSAIKAAADQLNELNESLELKNIELERSNDEMASFSYVASHDLQEPLRKIQTFTRLIIDKDFPVLSDKGKDYFQRMESAASRMQILIDDLLTFSRTNTLPKEFAPADLNELLESVKKQISEQIEEKNAVINASPLPRANVIAFQFKQLLENLLLNAIKYAKTDISPVINISADIVDGKKIEGLSSGKKYIKITVADNGIGFEQEYAEKIFELFQRLHGKHEYPGTGLGLAICRKIVQNHKGKIIADGKEGEGAVFTVFIPA